MGQEASTESEKAASGEHEGRDPSNPHPTEQQLNSIDEVTRIEALSAYRVMKVFQGSPASRSGLTPFEDFILALNRRLVNSDNTSLANVLSENEGREVALVVFNVVDLRRRDVALRPVKWNGPGLLGAAVRFEPIAGALDHVLRVIDILPDSPAHEAGLIAGTDYIAGTPAEVFRNENDFPKLINDALNRSATASVMVYSSATSRTRDVEIRPNRDWGGEGSLGCELASGLLHRITRAS